MGIGKINIGLGKKTKRFASQSKKAIAKIYANMNPNQIRKIVMASEIQWLRRKTGANKLNLEYEFHKKMRILQEKGIPPEIAQQIAGIWVNLVKGNIKSYKELTEIIKKSQGNVFFEIRGQKININFFLNNVEKEFLTKYEKILEKSRT